MGDADRSKLFLLGAVFMLALSPGLAFAKPPLCSESDGGDYPDVFGDIYYPYLNYYGSDYCDGSDVVEYYCEFDGPSTTSHSCPAGCSNGACNPLCSDSDGGNAPDTQGTLSYYGMPLWGAETCASPYAVLEQYCTAQGTPAITPVNCEYGCSNGACLPPPPPCYDSDNGNIYAQGTLYLYGTPYSDDFCQDENTLTEFFCVGDQGYYEYISCEWGCLGGRCGRI